MNNRVVPIFFACDDNFVKYTIVSLRSIIDNASKDYQYEVHVLHTNISERMQKEVLKLKNENFNIEFNNVSDYLRSINDKLPLRDYYSKTTYFRLFISEMFPNYNKAIYIDSDTVVLGDISELYNHELGENYVGACNEQAMIQVDTYGEYVEKVVGVSRYQFFNAGLLLINCNQFRKQNILDKFIMLLNEYNFVVTQDEDYLNLLCKDHVLWIEQCWNTEVFGTLPVTEDKIKMLHYIMVSKPWHFEDCRLKEYFFKYAKKTDVYDEILDVLKSYTSEQRRNDIDSCDRLLQLAKNEIAREDNYLNRIIKKNDSHRERLAIKIKIASYEREGRFDEDVENDPPSKELKPEDIDYLKRGPIKALKSKISFYLARKFLNKQIKEKKFSVKEIKGIENFALLNSGAIITCNHFNALDSFAIQLAYEKSNQKKRRFYRIIREGNYTSFPGFYGMLMRNCNTLPLSSNKKTMIKFMKSTDKLLKDGHFVLVYPEQSMWWNYRKPKPLKKGAFKFAARNNVPVLPCFITMDDTETLDDNGFYIQEYTIHVGKPIYPDSTKDEVDNTQYLLQENYNQWKQIYESYYGIPLVYTCNLTDDKKITSSI